MCILAVIGIAFGVRLSWLDSEFVIYGGPSGYMTGLWSYVVCGELLSQTIFFRPGTRRPIGDEQESGRKKHVFLNVRNLFRGF